uniref:prostaglandin reductase 2-like n=1 Tax=Ciona intestinalis TaxID=7719 RepID=UPI000521709F|nr:prostaglandin reductase 2-like [Ciona intestinalis]|eukprot:XP_009857682.1 prostaglandin reductase 2-like [Ciona intestinalis]
MIPTMKQNYRVFLKSRPGINGVPVASNFALEKTVWPTLPLENEVLVQTLYLSVDPYMRCRMNEDSGVEYTKAWSLGGTITGGGIGVVCVSSCDGFKRGDIVMTAGFDWPWVNYHNFPGEILKVVTEVPKEQLSMMLGLFGLTGLTGCLGVTEKGNIVPGMNQTVVVSGAAGACGSVAGQVAKIKGCGKLVGICGTETKCKFLTEELGFDAAICYRSQNVADNLSSICPNGVDVYFDNVGGEISNSVITCMNKSACIILCGQISVYNEDKPYPPPLREETESFVKKQRISRDRFLVLNYQNKFGETLEFLQASFKAGKLINKETTVHGLENAGIAFIDMMNGQNIGKQIVKVSELV